MSATIDIPDIQDSPDTRGIAIQHVGIKGLKHPIKILSKASSHQSSIATFSMFVDLPAEKKGTHMSRFVEILNQQEWVLSIPAMQELLSVTKQRLNSTTCLINADFDYFIEKTAPVSGAKSLMDYNVSFKGELKGNQSIQTLKIQCPMTTLCPCSKTISDYGAHNQRSMVTVTAQVDDQIWIEDIINLIEHQSSCEVYGVVKRSDEKYLTEKAYDNPKFVEDVVRDMALQLNQVKSINAYTIESENIESIHNHDAYAKVESTTL